MLRVLMAEDSEDDALLVDRALRVAGFDVSTHRVETAAEMKAALDHEPFDLVLSDFTMPTLDGFGALRIFQQSSQRDIPFVIVSGSIGEVRAVAALKAGAADYVMKDNLAKLAPVVERALRDVRVRRERAQAYEALQLAVTARDEFLVSASHELKTPLTSLSLHVETLRRGLDGLSAEQVRSKVESVAKSTGRLSSLVNRLLDVTRIAAGHLDLEIVEVDLVALAKGVAARVDPRIRVSAPSSLVGRWDGDRLDAVIANLVMNAIKYGQGKPIDIDIEDQGDEARLAVLDRGVGLSEEAQARVFERFEHGEPEHWGGFGVGLWLARQIVEAHGGRIRVDSTLGDGATFTIHLPKARPR